jgi:tetratricopeptide (TPR) repeat protein
VLETGGSEVERALREELRRVSEPAELRKLAEGFYAEPEVSVPTLERLIELAPEDLVVRVELGFVYFLMGEDGEANRQLAKARALDPEHVQVLTLEAALARDPTEKIRLYRLILQKDPQHEVARSKLHELGALPSGNGTTL